MRGIIKSLNQEQSSIIVQLIEEEKMFRKSAVQLKNVTKRISGKTIVDQLSFDIHEGEVFGLDPVCMAEQD